MREVLHIHQSIVQYCIVKYANTLFPDYISMTQFYTPYLRPQAFDDATQTKLCQIQSTLA